MIQTDSRLITLNSNDGISLNGDYKSNILFEASSNDNDSTGNMSEYKYDLENLN